MRTIKLGSGIVNRTFSIKKQAVQNGTAEAADWSWRLALCSGLGYLYAVIPPRIVDPLLTTHRRFGARHYGYAWMIAPMLVLVVMITWRLAIRRTSPGLLVLPFALVIATTNIVMFRQELPHIHLFFVGTIWTAVMGLWVWIHYSHELAANTIRESPVYGSPGFIECVKERVFFYRTLGFALMGAFFALLVTGLVAAHDFNSQTTVSDPQQNFILMQLNNCTFGVIGLLLMGGPIQELLLAWERTTALFLLVKGKHAY